MDSKERQGYGTTTAMMAGPDDDFFSGDGGVYQRVEQDGFQCRLITDRFNRRVNVVSFSGSVEPFARYVIDRARSEELDKIIVRAGDEHWQQLLTYGFSLEGIIKTYFAGDHAYHMAKFLSADRRISQTVEKEDAIIEALLLEDPPQDSDPTPQLALGLTLEEASVKDSAQLAELYGSVFDTYPTPMNDPSYIRTMIIEEAVFYVVRSQEGQIVSAASAVIDAKYKSAEMTDCATIDEYRGRGLMTLLLRELENAMERRDLVCLYSMARSLSYGMNKVFSRLGYGYSGRLINHCNIMGKLEDMNLWVKNTPHV